MSGWDLKVIVINYSYRNYVGFFENEKVKVWKMKCGSAFRFIHEMYKLFTQIKMRLTFSYFPFIEFKFVLRKLYTCLNLYYSSSL